MGKTLVMIRRVMFEKTALRYAHQWLGCRQVVKNGFWYVDVPRCSSTSVRAQLGFRFGRAHGRTKKQFESGKVKPYFIDHIPAQVMKKTLPNGAWEKLYTFSLVRNPWDRLLSLFYHRVKEGDLPAGMDFTDFVLQLEHPRYMLKGNFHSSPIYFMPMVDFLCDRDDRLIVDFVGRYERRSDDLAMIGEKIGCPELGELRMPITTSGREKTYVDEYNDQTRDVVARFYSDDIERFGYRFGD